MPSIEIIYRIEKLRALMYKLMNEKEKLTDPELVALSQRLDDLLNEYDKLLEES
ncbi:aspartyl-phosphate phosphatase Spo0E family protein [Clostridium sp. CF012]|uniref:aspartyl-phosphate phosphatase Spo0E family protein n=1 Tax=Clostridium sp. CF012 TaxID=2843319 RepID=UPI001C0C1AA9|nr:aspartyl-phosphate phosphatase Spo0E family protein [Clostridium sp. CF012]MBU3143961.1 aspartyl-phosphate phosphatase Spo0E family protein [Clostridium sp. CF012]